MLVFRNVRGPVEITVASIVWWSGTVVSASTVVATVVVVRVSRLSAW